MPKKYSFDPPQIVGAICDDIAAVPRELKSAFRKFYPKIAFLPFSVEKRHLKNTTACMRIMDIGGLAVCGTHVRAIAPHAGRLSPLARKTKRVHVITLTKGKFTGVDAMGLAVQLWIKSLPRAGGPKVACVCGMKDLAASIVQALKSCGYSVKKCSGGSCKEAVVVEKNSLTRRQLMGLFYHACVELLTPEPSR